jgi:hypothetical protein
MHAFMDDQGDSATATATSGTNGLKVTYYLKIRMDKPSTANKTRSA